MKSRRKRDIKILAVLLLVCAGIGYAFLNANLKIDGVVSVPAGNWDIHFDNIQVASGSVALADGDTAATIVPGQTNKVSYKVSLHNPGDYYEFTVDVVNAGTVDAMIDTVSSKLNNTEITDSNLPAYLKYKVTYADGTYLGTRHKLNAGQTETYRIKVEFKYKMGIDETELPNGEALNFDFQVDYVQADGLAIEKTTPTFSESTWETIVIAYNSGRTEWLEEEMKNGPVKEVQLDLNYDGTPDAVGHVRIANLSTPVECSTTGFSQTACGLVIEFADIITTHQMNPHKSSIDAYGNGNRGGWKYSEMRNYINTDIYRALPEELKTYIIDTTVVSGHGSLDPDNFTTTDKLYLFSTKEVWGKDGTSNVINSDSAEAETRQLDYYKAKGVTTASGTYSPAIKKNLSGSANIAWWLRSANSSINYGFYSVFSDGYWKASRSDYTNGVAPAFRIG